MQADTQSLEHEIKITSMNHVRVHIIYSIESIYFTKRAISYILTLHFCLSSTLLFSFIFVYERKK